MCTKENTSPLSHLRACVDAYKAGNWHGPGEELEWVLELLEDADKVMKFSEVTAMSSVWRYRYAALKGGK